MRIWRQVPALITVFESAGTAVMLQRSVWREKQTEAGSDDRIALEGTGEMIEIRAE